MALNLSHQTAAQFAARFWSEVRRARQAGDMVKFSRLITWVYERVQAGDITNNDVRLSFNAAYGRSLTLAQWNAFVTSRLVPIRDRYLAIQAEADL